MSRVRSVSGRVLAGVGWRLFMASERIRGSLPSLSGDRTIEWAWCLAKLRERPGRVLDFGAGNGFLSLGAALRGHDVVAVDLQPAAFEYEEPRIEYRQGDLNEMSLEPRSFDQVLNCSTIEHVGLEGRYGSPEAADGDLRAMGRLAAVLREDGDMLLTLPLGRDGVFRPYHRVYGATRLPRLLETFSVQEESCWAKRDGKRWEEVSRETAIAEEASASYYALGLFVLRPR